MTVIVFLFWLKIKHCNIIESNNVLMPYYLTLHVSLCCLFFIVLLVHLLTLGLFLKNIHGWYSPYNDSMYWAPARSVCSEVILSLLWQEKEDKAILQVEVQHLRQDNMRLQEESLTAAAQLRKFTEWFFHTIDKKPWWRLCQKPLEKHCTPLTYTSKPHSYCSSIRCRM